MFLLFWALSFSLPWPETGPLVRQLLVNTILRFARWLGHRHCTQAFVVKKTENKKPCRSAKTKLTCYLWYQARSKAGMTGGGSKLALSHPPDLKIQTQMYTNTIHNATVCVHFVKKDTFMETSFVENWSKSCLLLATSTRFIASVLKKYP